MGKLWRKQLLMKKVIGILSVLILFIGCNNQNATGENSNSDNPIIKSQTKNDNSILNTQDSTNKQTNSLNIKDTVETPTKKSASKCNCGGFVNWEQKVSVRLFDQPNGKVIDTLSANIKMENFLVFAIIDTANNWFKVEIGKAINSKSKIGWIKKGNYLGTFASNYVDGDTLFLYTKPTFNSTPADTLTKWNPNIYQITGCSGEWVKVRLTTSNKTLEGWLAPDKQCPNPYTTCN